MIMSNKMQMNCATMNRVISAFFINEASNFGVDFEDSKPQIDYIAELNKGNVFFIPGDHANGLKHFHVGRIVIPDIDPTIFNKGVYDWLDDELKDEIKNAAHHFSVIVKEKKYCDFVFSNIPDYPPFIADCMLDLDTNFRSRLIIGHQIMDGTYQIIWEFYCLLMYRFREVDDDPLYGKKYKDVDLMSDEEREKFNKQTKKQSEEEP